MRYVRGPAVHRATCTRDASAENAANTLVSEADAQNWEPPGKFADDGGRYSGFHWSAWTGGDNDGARLEANKVAHADRVVPEHLGCLTESAEIPRNVEDERVVIVDDDDQNAPGVSAPNASNIRCALASVSSYSASGSDIAVIPLPA